MKENGFALAKAGGRRYLAQTITDADYTDDIALLANTPAQAESLLQSLKEASGGTDVHANADKAKYMCFNQRGDISTLNGGSLKLVDKFTYQGSSVSSTETDIKTWLAKAWTAIDSFSVIWKSVLSDKMKQLFSCINRVSTVIWMHNVDAYGEKAWRQLHKNSMNCIGQVQEATSHKTAIVRPPTTDHENHPN